MSHIHIPDGIIPVAWWLGGYILTFLIMLAILKKIKKEDIRRKVPLTGIVTAIMLIGMSVPLGIVPLHLSLAVLGGVLLGPALGFTAVLVVNIILALFGHGGITLVGLNTLIIGTEAIIGSLLFKFLARKVNEFRSAIFATSIALMISLALMVSLVGYTVDFHSAIPHHHAYEAVEETHIEESSDHHHYPISATRYLFFSGWSALIIILAVAIIVEALGTALIISFTAKIRPDIVRSIVKR